MAKKAWSAPLVVHVVALIVVMVAVAAFIGTGATFTDDEGAGILQAQVIEHGHWTMANPLPRVDPTGADYPVHQPVRGSKGIAPLGKNLSYFVLLAGLGMIFGTVGMVGLSIAGTVAAALLAARLARELGASERATFWLVGLASPLFFDGFLVVAHSVAAALAAASALLGLRFLRSGRAAAFVGAVAFVGVATLVRTEAALWALGLAAGALAAAVGPGTRQAGARRAVILAVGSTAVMLAAWRTNAAITNHAIGSTVATPAGTVASTGTRGGVSHQILGLLRSWFELPGGQPAAFALVMVLLGLAVAWARAVRQGRSGARSTLALAGAYAAMSLYLAVSRPDQYVAGIAIVFPVLWAGIWLLGRPALRDPAKRLLVVSSALYAVFVIATEYSDGGAWQPGRYFFLAIPVIVPVVVIALANVLRPLARTVRAIAVACVLVAIGATATSAVASLHFEHQRSGSLATAVSTAAADAPAGDKGLPVAVTTYPFLPRSEWATFPQIRWQLVPEDRLSSYGTALSRGGIRRFILVTPDPGAELFALRASYVPVKVEAWSLAPRWRLIVLQEVR